MRLTAWATAESALCRELSEMLGITLAHASALDALAGASLVTTLPLSLAAERSEVCLAIGVDEPSAKALAAAMFGSSDVDPAMTHDMMCELTNVAAGAFKRTALLDGRVFTTGLPTIAAVDPSPATARKQWIGTAAGITIRFELALRLRQPKWIRVASLCEGMVVATDLRDSLGALLMPSGTRICDSHLVGLRRQLGMEHSIEIMEAA
jgi:hypothetical protein